ncbi:UDP-2,3-diacylglucosamine diphosphatase [Deefgea salmonis]|uniref:UDP-2,3-diacylglucosamine hydrolase n=1 Tax=Deefgea salmonis TaxID=2875502 RepID=A0ABS8BMW8_9NEIS|nr:UDP-2,3-diacylglucosamine diphosphatase [Deefgea salmonis]MCB5197065.1 UDP-2,3-diacylglucosamine diphosphatase [Deefgea salmonis]
MTQATYFISDLHLSPSDAPTVQAYQQFMRHIVASKAEYLYILGDLFEYWLGDDQLDEPFYAEQVAEIAAVAQTGVKVFFMAGNRDLLVGRRFASSAQLTVLPDPSLIYLQGQAILLGHGDRYCTDDIAYQRYRRLTHNPIVQWIWLHLPKKIRDQQIANLRLKSQKSNKNKNRMIMDVNLASIETELQRSPARVLIHGHTHRPAQHQHQHGIRWVIPDWKKGHGGYLLSQHGQISLHMYPDS